MMSALFLDSDGPAYGQVALSHDERDVVLSFDEAEQLEDEPGRTAFLLSYPGETPTSAAQRLKGTSTTLRVRIVDNSVLAFYSVKPGDGGRLKAWTDLQVGQAMCWGYKGDDPTSALRIAKFLEGRELGRFIVFDDDEGHGQWVRRVS